MSTLTDAIRTVINSIMEDVHTAIPGIVSKYDYTIQEAEVQPIIKRLYNDDTTESIPVIARVPVIFPRTAEAIIRLPLSKGDTGLIIFSEAALENWLSLGGEADPGDPRRFDLSDAVFIPGLYPFTATAPDGDEKDLEIIYKDSSVIIKEGGQVRINNDHLTID